MGRHGSDVKEKARQLYIVEGYSYRDIANMTGVSLTQISHWAADEKWIEQKKDYQNNIAIIESNKTILKKKLIAKAMETLNPQDVYAYIGLENASNKELPKDDPPENKIKINTSSDAVDALKIAIETKINQMIQHPESIELKEIKDLKDSLELIEKMEKQFKTETGATKTGLDDDVAEQIRRQILGVDNG